MLIFLKCQNVRLPRGTMLLVVSATLTYFNNVNEESKGNIKLTYDFQIYVKENRCLAGISYQIQVLSHVLILLSLKYGINNESQSQ